MSYRVLGIQPAPKVLHQRFVAELQRKMNHADLAAGRNEFIPALALRADFLNVDTAHLMRFHQEMHSDLLHDWSRS